MTRLSERIAAAPISWGVCEVPGWGHQLPAQRVLAEMRELGITATELGPSGFLPHDRQERRELLECYGLRPVGAFLPVVLFDGHDVEPELRSALQELAAAGARIAVLAAASGTAGYDERPQLTPQQWHTLLANLDRADRLGKEVGITVTLHPHVGTMVEQQAEVNRVLDGSVISLCLDTGHLLLGGTDPVELTRAATARIGHVHLKDVDGATAARVMAGELSYSAGVARGLYRPLGQGELDIAGIVSSLETRLYDGFYVMEQDTVLTATPEVGNGPYRDVGASLDHLRACLEQTTLDVVAPTLASGGR